MRRVRGAMAVDGRAWFADGIRFQCTRCGKCCGGAPGYVWVTRSDVVAMAGILRMETRDFLKQFVRRAEGALSLTEKPNGDCILWNGGCTVYGVRPAQCRSFPFWTEALRSADALKEVSRGCPGIGRGRRYTMEEIYAINAGLRDT